MFTYYSTHLNCKFLNYNCEDEQSKVKKDFKKTFLVILGVYRHTNEISPEIPKYSTWKAVFLRYNIMSIMNRIKP